MKTGFALALAGVVVLTACSTNREYRSADLSSEHAYKKGKASAQLKEGEVLGLRHGETLSDQDIQRILDETRTIQLKERSPVLLVQSGAHNPDSEMIEQLSARFQVIPYTGVPSELRGEQADLSKVLRFAAAEAKAETIIVYWGSVEIKRDDLPTGIVSWVPVVDFMVPDEYQKVRMHLKVALVDVRSGQWATFRTEPIAEQTLTTRYAREKAPNWPLRGIKEHAYQACVQKLVAGYVMARND
jgi:hypothetical protein